MKKTCIGCGMEFFPKWKKAKYCSIRCSKIGASNPRWNGGPRTFICKNCKKEFKGDSHTQRSRDFCSMACSKIGENNPNWNGAVSLYGSEHPGWKGEKVQLDALHTYIRLRLKNDGRCQECGCNSERLDLANKSQEYKRDVSDWEWLCRRCHMKKDGRLKNLKPGSGRGELNHRAKLSEMDVLKIYDLFARGMTNTEIAREYRLHLSTIGNIKSGKIWKHLYTQHYNK